jgi:hypothetical protein
MAAILLQSLFYFKNNGLMKRFTLKKISANKILRIKKGRQTSPHENIPPPTTAEPPTPFLAPFSPPPTPVGARTRIGHG